jgi:hypothetical protein
MRKFLLAVFLLSCASNAYGESGTFFDGNKLIPLLREFEKAERGDPSTNYQLSGKYIGYLLGVHDSLSPVLCLPSNVNVRQVAYIVTRYLHDNPSEWSDAAAFLVMKALQKAFPCPE